jgi:hypothetical protein
MAVPYTFATATTSIPLSQLDSNFATAITIGNTAVQLGNTITTLNNITLANVTISSGTSNTTIANGSVTNAMLANSNVVIGNTTIALGTTASSIGNLTLTNVTLSSLSTAIPNNFLANSTAVIGNTTITLGSTVTSIGNLTLTNVTLSSLASTIPNNFLSNSSVTLGSTALALGSTVTTVGNVTLQNVTISSGNVSANLSGSTVDGTNSIGFLNIPQNSQNGNYNVVLADSGKHIYHPLGQAAATYTIPANSNIAFALGTAITFINLSANAATIAVTTDTMYLGSAGTTGNRTLAQYGMATAVKIATTSWIISGTALT